MPDLKAEHQILPWDSYQRDVGNTYLMLHEAIALMQQKWVQPPHWTQQPTMEMLADEEKLLRLSKDAEMEIERLAGEIYKSLTGKTVTSKVLS